MRKADAISHYGSQVKLASALCRAPSTVSEWGDVVPLDCAFILERLTKRQLKVDFSLYPKVPDELRGRA